MPTAAITLIKGDKVSSNTDYRDALPVNMFAVEREILGAKGYMLVFPGLTQVAVGKGKDRGAEYNERMGLHFRVSGSDLITVGIDGTVTSLGNITGIKQASITHSFNTECVVVDGNMYLSDGSTVSQVTDADLGNPLDVVYIDGYYFLTDGEYVYHTDLADETSIDPLKFATAEFMPDPSLGLALTPDDKVMVFGRYSIEYFVNQANENFAFTRLETRAQKIGIVATHAKCESEGNWYITGGRREEALGVYVVNVGQAAKISTREIDKFLAQYAEPELTDMRMESVEIDDTFFIIIHLPNETLCYNTNLSNSMSKEYAWTILKTGTEDQVYRGINAVFDAKKGYWVFGDKQDGTIGKLDVAKCEQYSDPVELILYTPFVYLDDMSIDELEIETIPGSNLEPETTVAFSMTYDGLAYSKEYWNLYSEANDHNARFYLRRLGYVSDWVGFKFRAVTKARMAFALAKVTYG